MKSKYISDAIGNISTRHILMFYLSGKNIKSVRFSCKNQKIDFRDWSEKRDEYGEAKNFLHRLMTIKSVIKMIL